MSFVFVFLYGDVYRSLIELLHIPEKAYISWLGNERLALYSMGIAAVWQCAGYYMLIYIAGLQSIPPDLIEAARIDGASAADIIFRIKLPMLSPVIIMNTILLITAGFKTFDFPMAMTSGGPAGATTTIALYIYNTGFRSNRTGYATAQSVLLFLIICTITGLSIVISGAWLPELGLEGAQITMYAFQNALPFPSVVGAFLLMCAEAARAGLK